ncbi:MAG: hypothetical protein IT208_04595 [Chthonomonadales bacterium]|nr:hypothetical protein [Chthonomonadales bacterium]
MTPVMIEPPRAVLEGVPRVHFYDGGSRCPEDVPFPSCVRACLEYMNESAGCRSIGCHNAEYPLGCTYAWVLATSGAGFRLLWSPDRWDLANGDVMLMCEDPEEPFRRGLASLGFEHSFVMRQDRAAALGHHGAVASTPEGLLSPIVASVRDRSRPAMAFGVVGPPECCLVTGYDDGGDTLIGWSFFQGFEENAANLETEPGGYYRKRGWFDDTVAVLALGDRRERPPRREVYRAALAWGVSLMRTPRVRRRAAGIAGFDAWAASLLRDEEFAERSIEDLRARYIVHYDAVGTVAEARWYTAGFLAEAARDSAGMASALYTAASCFAAEHDLMWRVWALAGGNGVSDEHARKLAEPAARHAIAEVLRESRDLDARAADALERALRA